MRITYRMMTSKYTNNLNSLSTELDKLNTQVATGRKYSRTSEDVSSAIKGYQIRRSLSKVEGYQDNISHAQDFLTNSESTLSTIEDSLSEATDKVLQGMNGTKSQDERKIIATELRTIQDELLQTFNTNTADTYIYGGSNTNTEPFTLDEKTGQLKYNGKIVDDLEDGSADLKKLSSDSLYVDVGLGVSFDAGEVDRNTVFEYSIPGIKFVGNGVSKTEVTDAAGNVQYDADGNVLYTNDKVTIDGEEQNISNNVYDLLGQIADEFESDTYSFDTINSLYGHLQKATQKSYQTTTEIGSKTNYLDFMTSRYETQDFNLQKRQTEVEGVDAAYAYITYQTQKVAYEAALQMGSSVVQQSVFDYMT